MATAAGVDVPDLVGHREVAVMLGIGRQASWQLHSKSALPPPDVVLESGRGRPIWLRSTVERWARVTGRTLAVPESTSPQQQAPELVGLAEIAGMAGVAHSTAWQWRHRELLPVPEWPDLAGGPVWLRASVERWLRATNRWQS